MQVIARSIEETREFAEGIVARLKGWEFVSERSAVLGLSGPLGAGKTALVKCIASVLGVVEDVTSPTFVLRTDHPTADSVFRTLVHIDGYRLESPEEARTIGWDVLLGEPNMLVCVEWAERFGDFLPGDVFSVSASAVGDEHSFIFSESGAVSGSGGAAGGSGGEFV